MTILIHVDGLPYRISWSGTMEISRNTHEASTVLVGAASDDFKLLEISLDNKVLRRERRLLKQVYKRYAEL
jgi:hypothetical protein